MAQRLSTQPSEADLELEPPEHDLPNRSGVKDPEKFQPGWRFIAAFGSLCIITLMAALDATSLSVALPVSLSLLKSAQRLLRVLRLWRKL